MISAEIVTRTLERMLAMSQEQAQATANRMRSEQPYVMVYLLAISQRDGFTAEETETFLYIGAAVWQIMKQSSKIPGRITEKRLRKAEKANEDLLEKMASDSAGDLLSAAESQVENYPEPEVLRYITEALMEDEDGDPSNPPFREEVLGQAFLHLKIVLDALIGNVR